MSFEIITIDELLKRLDDYNHKELHVHHTWKPDHSNFNGSNGIELQQGMRNYHVNSLGWSDIGQHVTLLPDGLFVTGRNFSQTPASISGYNTGGFACETLGNFDIGNDILEGKQKDSLLRLAKYFDDKDRYVRFHRENAPKTCPGTSIDKIVFMNEVKNYGKQIEQPTPSNLYRVRLSWQDVKSQLAAFVNLESAIELAKQNSGYEVYDENGSVVFSGEVKVEIPIVEVKPVLQPVVQPKPQINQSNLAIQQKLNKLKITSDDGKLLSLDGDLGTKSKQAIRRLESICGLTVDEGIWGNECERAYLEIIGKPYCDMKNQSHKYAVRYIQWLTNASPIDGLWGKISNKCVYYWQKNNGLVADMKFGKNSWEKAIG